MSDPTNNTKVEEPLNTEIHTEAAPPASTEDITTGDAPTKTENEPKVKAEGEAAEAEAAKAESKPEAESKAEGAAKPEAAVKSEDTNQTEKKNFGNKTRPFQKKGNKRKFDASLVPIDPEKFDDQARTQVCCLHAMCRSPCHLVLTFDCRSSFTSATATSPWTSSCGPRLVALRTSP